MRRQGDLTREKRARRAASQAAKAATFLTSAQILADTEDWDGAVSRVYYSVFHKILAQAILQELADPGRRYEHPDVADLAGALLTEDIEVVSPINNMPLPYTPKAAVVFLAGLRVKGDYVVGMMGRNEAEIAIRVARNIHAAVERL